MRIGAVRPQFALHPSVLECVASAGVGFSVAGAVRFRRSVWPEAEAKAVHNLKAHIHTAPTNLERMTARTVFEICSVADVSSDVADGVSIRNEYIEPTRHPAG